jgi:hypothetical protein
MTSETDTNDDRIDHDHPEDSQGSHGPPEEPDPIGDHGEGDGHVEPDAEGTRPADPSADPDERAAPDGPAEDDELADAVPPEFPRPPQPSDDATADPDGVLTPADLERVAEQVRELDDERVLVPTDSAAPAPDDASGDRSPDARRGRPSPASNDTGPTEPTIETEAAYAVDVTVRTDHGVAADSFRSNDVRTVFESLLRWYAGRIDPDSDPETVVRVLLSASDLDLEVG